MSRSRKHTEVTAITAKEITDLLWRAVAAPGETRRQVDNRIRQWLRYHEKIGGLEKNEQAYSRDAVLILARSTWPETAKVHPLSVVEHTGSFFNASDYATCDVIPGSLDRCQQALRSAYSDIRNLQAQLAKVIQENSSLQADAKSWREFKSKSGRRSAL